MTVQSIVNILSHVEIANILHKYNKQLEVIQAVKPQLHMYSSYISTTQQFEISESYMYLYILLKL